MNKNSDEFDDEKAKEIGKDAKREVDKKALRRFSWSVDDIKFDEEE